MRGRCRLLLAAQFAEGRLGLFLEIAGRAAGSHLEKDFGNPGLSGCPQLDGLIIQPLGFLLGGGVFGGVLPADFSNAAAAGSIDGQRRLLTCFCIDERPQHDRQFSEGDAVGDCFDTPSPVEISAEKLLIHRFEVVDLGANAYAAAAVA